MLIPLIPKNIESNDFTCKDGEIEFQTCLYSDDNTDSPGSDSSESGSKSDISELSANTGYGIRFALEQAGDFPTAVIRVALESGDSEKAALMMQGQISRVDAASAERITRSIVLKAAEEFSGIVLEKRKLGQHLLPFRIFGIIRRPDSSEGFPSAQAVILPAEYPPHPEITAHSIVDNTLTLSLRIPVCPQRLKVIPPSSLPEGYGLRTYVSYPLYIPKADEITGTLGSVRSATGGNATGIRFAFLSTGNLKYSVAAPEKYYLLTGNEKTGYRMASKAAELPDYSEYAGEYGYVPPFTVDTLRQQGSTFDPLDWIADWEKAGDGYLPQSLPYIYRSVGDASSVIPDGVDSGYVSDIMEATGCSHLLLTRPMTFADAEKSRRKAETRGVKRLKIHGLKDNPCLAVLFGSMDGTHYEPLRQFNPHATSLLMSPPRLFHRLLLLSDDYFPHLCIQVELMI